MPMAPRPMRVMRSSAWGRVDDEGDMGSDMLYVCISSVRGDVCRW